MKNCVNQQYFLSGMRLSSVNYETEPKLSLVKLVLCSQSLKPPVAVALGATQELTLKMPITLKAIIDKIYTTPLLTIVLQNLVSAFLIQLNRCSLATSVPCKRSFSAMWRLKSWSRSTMADNRLTGLALLFIDRDVTISRDNILKHFDSTGHRRIGRLNL